MKQTGTGGWLTPETHPEIYCDYTSTGAMQIRGGKSGLNRIQINGKQANGLIRYKRKF